MHKWSSHMMVSTCSTNQDWEQEDYSGRWPVKEGGSSVVDGDVGRNQTWGVAKPRTDVTTTKADDEDNENRKVMRGESQLCPSTYAVSLPNLLTASKDPGWKMFNSIPQSPPHEAKASFWHCQVDHLIKWVCGQWSPPRSLLLLATVLMVPAGRPPGRPPGGKGTVAGGKDLRREKKPYERGKKMVEVKYQYCYGNDHALQTLSDEIQCMKLCGSALTIPRDRIYGIILEQHQKFKISQALQTYREEYEYYTTQKLGEGTYGCVSLLRDVSTSAQCARKMVDVSGYEKREVEILLRMGTGSVYLPHLVGLGLHGRHVHIFMQYVETTWYKYVKESAEKEVRQGNNKFCTPMHFLCVWLHDSLQGILYLHKHGIQHRDIKPQNLGLCRLSRDIWITKLLDFGAAITTLDQEGLPLAGTLNYLAPLAAGRVSCLKDDIWGLGCSAIFMLILYHPWYVHEKGLTDSGMHESQRTQFLIKYIATNGGEIVYYTKLAFEKTKEHWQNGAEAKSLTELLCFMLSPDVGQRYSAEQCLQHQFFAGLDNRDHTMRKFASGRDSPGSGLSGASAATEQRMPATLSLASSSTGSFQSASPMVVEPPSRQSDRSMDQQATAMNCGGSMTPDATGQVLEVLTKHHMKHEHPVTDSGYKTGNFSQVGGK